MNKNTSKGYTLVELVIVVGMVGILSSMAYSAYTGYTKEADRAQAQADLYEIAQIMEREFTTTRSYLNVDLADLDAFDERYDFSFNPPRTAIAYTIEAIAGTSRDVNDMQLDNFGNESYKMHGTSTWILGWDNIPN